MSWVLPHRKSYKRIQICSFTPSPTPSLNKYTSASAGYYFSSHSHVSISGTISGWHTGLTCCAPVWS